jgi:hypothetical protein
MGAPASVTCTDLENQRIAWQDSETLIKAIELESRRCLRKWSLQLKYFRRRGKVVHAALLKTGVCDG